MSARLAAGPAPAEPIARPRTELPWGWPAATAALLLLSLLPLLLADIPAMVDYPNHLARMSILARSGTAEAHPHYQVAWGFYPNLAMDLLVPPLVGSMSVEGATRLFLVASALLLVSGAVAIEVSVKGRAEIAGLAACFVLYSHPFAWGFMNFAFGLGIALWAIAAAIAIQDRPIVLRVAAGAAAVPVLYVSHLFALGVFGATVGVLELWRWRHRLTTARTAAAVLAAMAIPLALLLAATALLGGSVGGAGTTWGMNIKPVWLFSLNGYSLPFSIAATAFLILRGYAAARTGAVRLVGAGPWLAIGFALLFLAMPFRLFDTAFVDVRVLLAAALILPAFIAVRWPAPGRRLAPACWAALLIGSNLALVWTVQGSYRAEYARLVSSFSLLDRGAKVLIGHVGEADDPPAWSLDEYQIYHGPVLAAHYADAFVPTLFTYAGKQPIRPGAHVASLALNQGGPTPMNLLVEGKAAGPKLDVPPFVRHWTRDYDYLYVIGPPAQNPFPDRLRRLAAGQRFALYKIER